MPPKKKNGDDLYQLSFDFDDWLDAPVTDEPARLPLTARFTLAQCLADLLATHEEITPRRLNRMAAEIFGGTLATGAFSSKDTYDALEVAVNLHLRATETADWTRLSAAEASEKARALTDLLTRLPTQTRRDQEQDEFQQFSTPPALSFVANWVANVRPEDVMIEPQAGTGDLAIWSELAGADLILNELAPRRIELLAELFPDAALYRENAEQLHNILPRGLTPTVAVLNPPFSATAGRVRGQRDSRNGARHLEQVLLRLGDQGRMVAIVGEGMLYDRPAFRSWWRETEEKYNVRAVIGISGQEYRKYGTTFDNALIVIDKAGPTRKPVQTGFVQSVAELPEILESIRHERPGLRQATAAQPAPTQPAIAGDPDRQQDSLDTHDGAGELGPDSPRPGDRSPGLSPGDSGARAAADEAPGSARGGDAPDDGERARGAVRDRPGRRPDSGRGAASGRDRGVTQGGSATDRAAPLTIQPQGSDSSNEEEDQAPDTLTNSVFTPYRPQRLAIPGAHPHPGPLVQSAAMGAVEPPAPSYQPHLPPEVIDQGLLSLAQLETVVYAGDAHAEILPDGFRKGYFIGDGTGVGKGREISGVILDNLMQGRQKAVWISFNDGLINDAKRDFAAVGGDPDLIFWHGKTKPGQEIQRDGGILFTTYTTLRSGQKRQATESEEGGQTRLDQIVKWLGADFDGVIAFDEAHSMGNALDMKGKRGVKKAAQQAIAGVNLQREVPQARVLYVSATGATEVANLSYAERLGLWGEGSAFADKHAFIGQIAASGVAGMEIVARDLKALGLYAARSLSFDEVTYERLEHPLSDFERDVYNELARAWQVVLENVDEALGITGAGANGPAVGAALSQFWSAHQRFFNQIITALQTPAAIDHMRAQLDAGNAIVIQIVNTNEAGQERLVAQAAANGTDLEELDFTPRQALIDYIRHGFPIQQFVDTLSPDGNVVSVPATDSEGNPIFNREAIEMRDALIRTLEQIRVPENPLDSIINAFGSDQVAEITGRSRRFVQTRDEEGRLRVVEEKRGKNAARVDATMFQDDQKRILVFSGAGGTGYSFHADNTAVNRRRRIHYILQPGWRADQAVQGFGRSHRTNQASAPHYVLPTTDLQAQRRFISSIARRLDQLGALTRGQRQATSQGLFSASDNLESDYARGALNTLFIDLYQKRTPLSFADVTKQMGLRLLDDDGRLAQDKIPDVPQFLNRLLSLTIDMQDAVFLQFESRLVEAVEYAKQQGMYDEGLQTLRALSIRKTRDEAVYTHKRSGAETRYIELAITNPIEYLSWDEIQRIVQERKAESGDKPTLSGWFVHTWGKQDGQVFYLVDRGVRLTTEGTEVNRGICYGIRKGDHRYIDNAREIDFGQASRRVNGANQFVQITRRIEEEEARLRWQTELARAPDTETRTDALLVGAILPIWDRVVGSEEIYRLQTDDGELLLGRRMGPRAAQQTLKNLGVDSGLSKLTPREIFESIHKDHKAVLANGWEISPARVAHEQRIEIKRSGPFTTAELDLLKQQGAFVERINWALRAFLPVGEDGLAVFERITEHKPVVDLFPLRDRSAAAEDPAEDPDALGYDLPARARSPEASSEPGSAPRRTPATPSATRTLTSPDARADAPMDDKRPYHEIVAERLIEQLRQGTAPWQRPWSPSGAPTGLPMNPVTGKSYRGINAIWLMAQGRDDARWMTLKQANSVGAHVRKGEHSTRVVFWQFDEERLRLDADGKPVRDDNGDPIKERVKLERPIRRSFSVFNAEQVDGLPEYQRPEQTWDPVARAELILTASGAVFHHAPSSRAFYRYSTDSIHLPERGQFPDAEGYYRTALHELGHWTGHESRLHRDMRHPKGSRGYAREELRAEIASMRLGEELALGHDPGPHAAYVASWIEILQEDPMEIFRAAAEAERITDFVRGLEQQHEQALQAALPDPVPIDLQPRSLETLDGVDVLIWSLHEDMQRADDGFQRELERVYGKEAGTARYRDAHDDPQVQAARDGFRTASEAWQVAVADHRAYLTMRRFVEAGRAVPEDALGRPAHWWRSHLAAAEQNHAGWLQDTHGERTEEESRSVRYAEDLVAFAREGLRVALARAPAQAAQETGVMEDTPPAQATQESHPLTYIDVPYRDKDQAKALGARWDRGAKSWYIPPGVEPQPFARWARADSTPPQAAPRSVQAMPSASAEAERLYLAVPYRERDAAKALGARWDRAAKSWYVEPARLTEEQLAAMAQWRPDQVASEQAPPLDPRAEFREALLGAGFLLQDPHPIMDGTKQRVPVEGDTDGARGGYYKAYLDGHPAGTIKNYRTGQEVKWVATGYRLSEQERAKLRAEAAATLAAREAERDRAFEATAARLSAQFAGLSALSKLTPYQEAKHIGLDPGVRTDGSGTLFVPALDASGKHWTTQYIQPDGTKRFARESRKEGCFYVTGGGGPDALKDAPRILIAEGYATAMTLTQVVGYPVVTAFSADNLKPVAADLHARFPAHHIVIAGDDDRHLVLQEGHNRGRDAAQQAAAAVGGTTLFPIFAPGDFRRPEGLEATTPETYRAHCQAKSRLDRAQQGELSLTPAQRADLTGALLNDIQLNWLSHLKQHSDFNDLSQRSRFGLEGVTRQILAMEERLAYNGQGVRLPFDRLNERQQEEARHQFLGAKAGDGYLYELFPDAPDARVFRRRRDEGTDKRRHPRPTGDTQAEAFETQKRRKVRVA